MATMLDHPPPSEQSSDNEEITKLFPKCRPRSQYISDINQNKVVSPTHSLNSIIDHSNDNFVHNNSGQYSPAVDSDASELSPHGRTKDLKLILKKNNNSSMEEDHSIVSAYDKYGFDCSSQFSDMQGTNSICDKKEGGGDVVYDADLDVGYHVSSPRPGFRLRESRIEIAGGREIFSKSRSKPSKKRHSDEVVYHSLCLDGSNCVDLKRRSGEVLYDEKLSRYTHSWYFEGSTSPDIKSNCQNSKMNSSSPKDMFREDKRILPDALCNGTRPSRKSSHRRSFHSVNDSEHRSFSSGPLVYEAPVYNAEVVYDDIEELIDQQKLDSRCGRLQVKSPTEGEPNDPYKNSANQSPSDNQDNCSLEGEGRTRSSTPENSAFETYSQSFAARNETNDWESNDDGSVQAEEDANADSYSLSKLGIARIIGNVPIAQYEGSPRRYGPRPGYPQRVLPIGDNRTTGELPLDDAQDDTLKVVVNSTSPDNSTLAIDNGAEENCVDKTIEQEPNLESTDNLITSGYLGLEGQKSLEELEEIVRQYKGLRTSVSETDFNELEYKLYRVNAGNSYVGQRLASSATIDSQDSPKRSEKDYRCGNERNTPIKLGDTPSGKSLNDISFLFPNERELLLLHEQVHQHTLQVEMVDQDRESLSTFPGTEDLGETEVGEQVDHTRNFTLSPETTDCDSNDVESEVSFEGSLNSGNRLMSSMPVLEDGLSSGHTSDMECGDPLAPDVEPGDGIRSDENPTLILMKKQISEIEQEIARKTQKYEDSSKGMNFHEVEEYLQQQQQHLNSTQSPLQDLDLSYLDPLSDKPGQISNKSSPAEERSPTESNSNKNTVSDAIREIKQAIQHSKRVQLKNTTSSEKTGSSAQPVWVPRLSQPGKQSRKEEGSKEQHSEHPPEDDCDTDQETDRLLGAQRSDDHGFFDDKEWHKPRLRSLGSSLLSVPKLNLLSKKAQNSSGKKKNTSKEALIHEPAVLIEGVLFRARYLGSTQLVCEGQPTKATRMMQAEEAVSRIKAPEGETQPRTEVDLFISTEKIMVLNTDLKEIMMDHALRTISYIADIGDLVVLMARRRMVNSPDEPAEPKIRRTPKMICHVFESEEAQFIAQSIGQAFQVAYMEFLKANGIEDSSFVKEMDYQEVLNSQEIFGNELEMFAKKEKQKEVVVPKQKGEILGMVIVESGWGSMLPTVVIANMAHNAPAARCGQLNIGDQIIAINGISLVGLPLSTCQNYIKNTKTQNVVKLTVVPCAPVVEVKIKRPDTKYQLGFSVQNGVICSLLRGGIAERGGVRVGHRIIEINGQSVVAVPHEKIVNLLATSVGEIHMKTMPTSMFRLLTGQETPVYI